MKKNNEKMDVKDGTVGTGKELLQDIHALSRRMNIDFAVLAGVMEAQGWKDGKEVDLGEFEEALTDFLGARAG